jgi:hypothetical protein
MAFPQKESQYPAAILFNLVVGQTQEVQQIEAFLPVLTIVPLIIGRTS